MIVSLEEIQKAKILAVDDNEMNLLLLQKMLKQEGYQNVSITTDPAQVESLFIANDYDMILLDLNMPKMNGFDVMRMFKEKFSDRWIPVLVLTAQNDYATKIRCLSLGAKDFLTKPIEKLEAINRIRNILETKIIQNKIQEQNDVLELKVKARTKELEDSYNDLTQCLIRASKYKDNETGNHISRMSGFSYILAQKYGFNKEDLEHMRNASSMHDLGKIGIADNILLKPGKLDPAEFEIMKKHAEIGHQILMTSSNQSPMIKMSAEIALCHHEKWDGSGYPKGLKGEEIPISARIVALADVFDALTSLRPYKKPWTNEDAIKYINDNSGKHFDPKVVEFFNQSLQQFIELQQKYKEEYIAENSSNNS